jgi:hypothetical protein
MASQPNNSRIVQVINFGVDKRIPLGVVNQVIDKSTGNLIGYMRGDKFYELNTDAAVVDAEEAKAVETKNKFDQTLAAQQAQADPFLEGFSKYKLGVTIDPETGKTIVADGDKGEVFIYVGPSAPRVTYDPGTGRVLTEPAGKDTDIEVVNNFDALRNKILTDATATPGGIDSLFEKLYKSGSISEETYKSKNVSADDFNKGLLYSVRKFSIETIDKYVIKGDKTPVNFTDFLVTGFKSAKPTSKTSYDAIVTKRQDAAEDADQFFMANLGRNATKEEENAYYELLRDAEKKAVTATTVKYDAEGNQIGRTSTGDLMSELDKTLLLGKVAGKAIQGSDINTLLTAGGAAAKDVNSILAYAKNYGVVLTKEQAMNYVANNFRKGQNIEASRAKILQIAKSQPQYAAIADKITNDVSVKELAGNYIYQKAQMLELNMDAIDVFDKDIQDGLTGNLSMTDFNKRLRVNPAWANTKNAKEEAANYATDILKSFGLMG